MARAARGRLLNEAVAGCREGRGQPTATAFCSGSESPTLCQLLGDRGEIVYELPVALGEFLRLRFC